MNTRDAALTTGEQPTAQTGESRYTEGSKPSPKSSEKSTSSPNGRTDLEQSRPIKTEADKLKEVTALLKGGDNQDHNSGAALRPDTTATGTDSGDAGNGDDQGILSSKPGSREVDDGGTDEHTDTSDEPGGDGSRLSVKELATQLGTSPKNLYDNLEITTGDGETLSLGEIKDRVREQGQATREIVERERALTQRETVALENLALLQQVFGDLKGKLSQTTIERLQKRTQEQEATERRLLHAAMPELSDPNRLETFRSDVAGYLEQFGFKSHELVIRDHRIARALKHAVDTQRQLDKLMSFDPGENQQPPKANRPQNRRPRKSSQDQIMEQARHGNDSDKAQAVSSLLRSRKR